MILRINKNYTYPLIWKETTLFGITGSTESAVRKIFSDVAARTNAQTLGLLSDLCDHPSNRHHYRGYTILNSSKKIEEVQKCFTFNRPICFIFTGLGCQFLGMGKDMFVKSEIFRKSIVESDKILQMCGFNLINLILDGNENDIKENSLLLLAAIQIAYIDCFESVGIRADLFLGHSAGETACGYYDGCLSREETLWYAAIKTRGDSVYKVKGGMAAVGMTWEEAIARCPPGIYPACNNSANLVTISGGPPELLESFIQELRKDKIFVRLVDTNNKPYHCPFTEEVVDEIESQTRMFLRKIKPRTNRWISTSIPSEKEDTYIAKMCSSGYFANNFTKPVLFYEAMQKIPSNAIVIEVGPHCLLEAIIKPSLSTDNVYIPVANKRNPDFYLQFLSCLGKLYIHGGKVQISRLFPVPEYPVSKKIPMISPLIEWDHSVDFPQIPFNHFPYDAQRFTKAFDYRVTKYDRNDAFLLDHKVDGKVIFPAAGYLIMVWKTLALQNVYHYESLPVVFKDVTLHKASFIPDDGICSYDVTILRSTGKFKIFEKDDLLVTGCVCVANSFPEENLSSTMKIPHIQEESLVIKAEDIYKFFRLCGYEYGSHFRGITLATEEGDYGILTWNNNWITYLDSILQFPLLKSTSSSLRLPVKIDFVRINPCVQKSSEFKLQNNQSGILIYMDDDLKSVIAGGVQIKGISTVEVSRMIHHGPPVLEEYAFIPYNEKRCFSSLSEYEKQLDDYNNLCFKRVQECINKLLAGGNLNIDTTVLKSIAAMEAKKNPSHSKSCRSEDEKRYPLAKMLMQIFDSIHEDNFINWSRNLLVNLCRNDCEFDPFLSSVHHYRMLKPCFDVVLENIHDKDLTVIELESCKWSIITSLKEFTLGIQTTFEFVITDEDASSLDTFQKKNVYLKKSVWKVDDSPYPSKENFIISKGVLTRNIVNVNKIIQNVSNSLKPWGFAMFVELSKDNPIARFFSYLLTGHDCLATDEVTNLFEASDLKIISHKSDNFFWNMFLVRKIPALMEPKILHIDETKYEVWLDKLKTEINGPNNSARTLWLVSEKQPTCGIVGFMNCLIAEGATNIRCIFDSSLKKIGLPSHKNIFINNLVMNIYRDGEWGSFRFLPIQKERKLVHQAYVYGKYGDLSSMEWCEIPMSKTQEGNKRIDVYFSSISNRDSLLAAGKLSPDVLEGEWKSYNSFVGSDMVGRDESGRRVIVGKYGECLATNVNLNPDEHYLIPIPDQWTLAEAATVLDPYSTAYYSLIMRGNLQSGESILIHSGKSCVGQAAISIALHLKCVVFVTVGSNEEREYLLKRFPNLKKENFSHLGNCQFQYNVLHLTNGKGVDIVLNSLTKDNIKASLGCLAENGRFLQVEMSDIIAKSHIDYSDLKTNISFHCIQMELLNAKTIKKIEEMIIKGIEEGTVRPFNYKVFGSSEVQEAFAYMAYETHNDKVLIQIREEGNIPKETMPDKYLATSRFFCSLDKVYIITGGLGGLGLELTKWLVDRGARKIILISRTGIRNGYQKLCLKQWQRRNVTVLISKCNITIEEEVEELVKKVIALHGPVGGIFHLAMVLKDALFKNQTIDSFRVAIQPKIEGMRNFDRVSRRLCPHLDCFVVFSSLASGRGNIGQTNYAFANSTLERISEKRTADNLPCVAIQWGAIGDVGFVFDNFGRNDIVLSGSVPQRMISCFKTLDFFLSQEKTIVCSVVLANLSDELLSKKHVPMVEALAKILGISDLKKINHSLPLSELGLDSLTMMSAFELLQKNYGLKLTPKEMQSLTFEKLALLEKTKV